MYVDYLSRNLLKQGWDVRVAFHQTADGVEPLGEYEVNGVKARVLAPVHQSVDRHAFYSNRVSDVLDFQQLLEEFQPDIVHLHDFSAAAGVTHIQVTRAFGSSVAMNYHSQGQSCLQRQLAYRGQELCDGFIDPGRCAACQLQVGGVPRQIAQLISGAAVAPLMTRPRSKVGRAITLRSMTNLFSESWRVLTESLDAFVVSADWAHRIAIANGIPSEKIHKVKIGLPAEDLPKVQKRLGGDVRPLQILFLGRCDPIKGVDVLVDALTGLPPSVKFEAYFFGPYWENPFGLKLQRRMRNDPRIRAPRMLFHAEISRKLLDADVLAIPSAWPETGPLVALEAAAAGLPVVGSRVGGVEDIVTDGVNGLLVEPRNAAQLGEAIKRLAEEPDLVSLLREGVAAPRSMSEVARDMSCLYEGLL